MFVRYKLPKAYVSIIHSEADWINIKLFYKIMCTHNWSSSTTGARRCSRQAQEHQDNDISSSMWCDNVSANQNRSKTGNQAGDVERFM